jgi:crotonobetainyl-CoA:carnitine CoA-transferase CaiB-like acyl-CoA transferase
MFASGEVPGRWGNEHPNLAPYQVFRSADGHFIVGAGNDGQFRRLCSVIGREALGTDPRFRTVADRNLNRPALIDELQSVMATRNTAHWVERLAEVNVPSAPINDYKQVFEHPQVKHRQLRIDQAHGGGGVASTVANPIRLSATPIEYRIAPPLLGEHSVAVLTDLLGKTPAEIDRLVSDGVVGRPPTSSAGHG